MSDTPESPLAAKILEMVPSLTGAIDRTFREETGQHVAFVLVAFIDGSAVHASNITPASAAMEAMVNLAASYSGGTSEMESFDVTGTVPH